MKHLSFIMILHLFINNVFSQTYNWEFVGAIEDDSIGGFYDIQIAHNDYMFIGTEHKVIFRSTDNGYSWENIRPPEINWTNPGWKIIIDDEDSLFLCTSPGVWKSADYGESWRYLMNNFPHPNGPGLSRDMLILPNKNYVAACMWGIYLSEDNGDTWNYTNSITANDEDLELGLNGYIFAANPTASWFGLYRSIDGGYNWDEGWGLPTWCFTVLSDSTIFAGTDYGLYKTTNHGEEWFEIGNIYTDNLFATREQSILTSTYIAPNVGTFISRDKGLTWQHVFDMGGPIAQDSAGYIYIATVNGVYKILESVLPVELLSFTALENDNQVFLNWTTATETNNKGFEVQRTINDEQLTMENWESVGFVEGNGTTTEIHNYSFVDKHLKSGVYKYRLKQIDFDGTFEYSKTLTVEINRITEFRLYQNYPNPFNSNTVIKYSIKKKGTVSLNMYNLLGEHLVTLINETQNSGKYQIEFDAKKYELNSGIYLLRLQNDGDVYIIKLIYLK